MIKTNYECENQLSIFDFLTPSKPKKQFDAIEEFAKRGSGFQDGKQRIADYFAEDRTLNGRAEFLKKEYGVGGFGSPDRTPYRFYRGNYDCKGCDATYIDDDNNAITVKMSYKDLANAIDRLMSKGMYCKPTGTRTCKIANRDCNHKYIKEVAISCGIKCVADCCLACNNISCGARCNPSIGKKEKIVK